MNVKIEIQSTMMLIYIFTCAQSAVYKMSMYNNILMKQFNTTKTVMYLLTSSSQSNILLTLVASHSLLFEVKIACIYC